MSIAGGYMLFDDVRREEIMIKKKILALLISLGVVSSPALAAEKFLNNDLNISNRFKKQEPKSGAEQFREDTGMDPIAAFFLYTQFMRELIGYGNGYKISIDKANIGYAVKKICEYNSKEARKERLSKKTNSIFNERFGKEGKVGKLLRAEMRDQNFVDFFNSVIEKKIDFKLATLKILSEEVVDEMLAVTSMTNKEKEFIKDNVDFYLCPVMSYGGGLSFNIYGFLKAYKFLEVYANDPGIVQNYFDDPCPYIYAMIRNMFVCVHFSDGQLMDGNDYTKKCGVKPLNILKKVNGKFVLAD